MNKILIEKNIDFEPHGSICDFLVKKSGLSKVKVKDAMQKGALQVKTNNGKFKRVRRAKTKLARGSYVMFYYDEKLLKLEPTEATLLKDNKDYSVWIKPSGMVVQGTKYGDHCSLLRYAELYFKQLREVFLLHRLDREASGIVLIAHNKKAAAKLSKLFAESTLIKEYKIEVLGHLEGEGTIDKPLDNKKALTKYQVIDRESEKGTILSVTIETGRFHQIRRHFNMIGYPVMGDPKYGQGNKNRQGMKLAATGLKFKSPFSHKDVAYRVPEELMEW